MMKYSPAGVDAGTDSPPERESRTRGRLARRLAQRGIPAVVLLAALLIGGADPRVQVALSFAALMTTCAWALSRRGDLRLPPFAPLVAVAVTGTLLQLIPLPGGLVELLSPRALEIRTDALGRRPGWLPLTLDVPATILAAARGLAVLGILLVTAKAVRWRGRSLQLAVPLALAGGLIGLLSFAQRWFQTETILGLYRIKDMPGSGFFGTFVNGNHAASFFALSALVGVGCARENEGHLRLGIGISVAVSILALVSTGSRMGLVGLAIGGLALAGCWVVERLGSKRGLLVTGVAALVVGPLVLILALSQRAPAGGGSLAGVLAEQKVRGWVAGLELTREFPLTGVGRGAFEGPAAAFRRDAEGVRLVFPENVVVQMLSEWGIPLTLALLALFVLPTAQLVRRLPRWEPIFQGAACGVLAVLAHELGDFGLELPGVAFPTAMALGLCAGRLQISLDGAAAATSPRPRVSWPVLAGVLGVWAVVLAFAVWAAPRTSESEGRTASSLSRQNGAEAKQRLQAMAHRHPAEYYFELTAARHAIGAGSPEALRHINRALRLFPGAPAPHLLAFRYLASIGRRTQAAVEYRLAVERGHRFSYEEVARLVGPANVMRAVPQRPEDLLNLAQAFASAGRSRDADAASAWAVELAEGREAGRVRRLEIALRTQDRLFQQKAASELARIADSQQAIELAAEGLARSGDLGGAGTLLRRGLEGHPGDGSMRLRAARILFNHGDSDGARAVLTGLNANTLPLAERIATDELLAAIADKQGHTDAAAAARARARMLGRLQKSGTPP